MPSCLVHTGDESVTLSAATVKRLLDRGDGDAALLYLALLRRQGTVPPRSLAGELRWDRGRIEAFCRERGIALYDTAVEVVRLKDNASDNFLQVVREVDLASLLARIPACRTLVTTGQKATDTLRAITGCDEPAVGQCVGFEYAGRDMRLWRMPSSSRAYPRPVEWKAEFYRKVFEINEIL